MRARHFRASAKSLRSMEVGWIGEEIAREKLAPRLGRASGAGDVAADSRSYKSRRCEGRRVMSFRRGLFADQMH